MKRTAPTQPPRDVRVSILSSTSISVHFAQPAEQFINGVNLGYKVR